MFGQNNEQLSTGILQFVALALGNIFGNIERNGSCAEAKKGKGEQGNFCTIGQGKTDAVAALDAVLAMHQTCNRGGETFKFRIGNNRAGIRIAIAKDQRGFIWLMLCAIF